MEGMAFIIAFFVTLAVLAATLFVFFGFTRKSKNGLLTLSIGMWLMLFVLNFPFDLQTPLDYARTTLTAATKALQVFALNREFLELSELAGMPEALMQPYLLAMALLYLAAPIITASYLLQFVQGVRSRWLWMFSGRQETWFFTEVSEKALQLARSALEDPNESVCVVFCGVKKEDADRVLDCGAIPFSNSIDGMSRRYFRKRPSTVLCMSDSDERNLDAALNLMEKHHQEDQGRGASRSPRWPWQRDDVIFLYVFTDRPEAELLLNAADKRGFQCRRIAENRAIVYAELMKINAALEEAGKLPSPMPETDDDEPPMPRADLRFLLMGCGGIGFEMLRALIWLYGRDDIRLTLTVVDQEDVRSLFRRLCPGLRDACGEGPATDDKRLAIRFIQPENIAAFELDGQYLKTDYVFVALEEDAKSLETAIYLRQAFRLLKRNDHPEVLHEELPDFSLPEIRVAVTNPANKRFQFEDMNGRPYNIKPFGDEQGYYRISTMLNYPLERRALLTQLSYNCGGVDDSCAERDCEGCPRFLADNPRCALRQQSLLDREAVLRKPIVNHLQWRETVLLSPVTRGFYDFNYNTASSRCSALYDLCKAGSPVGPKEEHKRWMQYVLTEGFQRPEFLPLGSGEKVRDWTARLHSSLVEYRYLTAKDKRNDKRVIASGKSGKAHDTEA